MSEVTIDVDTLRRMFASTGPVIVRDEAGKNLGTFVPSETFIRELYEWAKAEFGQDEIQRPSPDEAGSPIDEVWQRIHQRKNGAA